jgi:hypothetical protein
VLSVHFIDGCLAEEQREFYLTGFVLVEFWIQKWSYLVSYETQAGGVVHHDWPFFVALPHLLYSLSWLGMQIEQVDVYFSENNPSPLSRSSSWKNSLPLFEGQGEPCALGTCDKCRAYMPWERCMRSLFCCQRNAWKYRPRTITMPADAVKVNLVRTNICK